MTFLKAEGFSAAMIDRFFVPFFGGVCLDPKIRASSRVLRYVLRMFASGDAALPAMGMEEIPGQLVCRPAVGMGADRNPGATNWRRKCIAGRWQKPAGPGRGSGDRRARSGPAAWFGIGAEHLLPRPVSILAAIKNPGTLRI
jgi:hypothetical protein